MSKKYKIGIAILPPEEYCSFVKEKEIYLSKKYDTLCGLLQPPNVTVKSPFEVENLSLFEDYCENLVKQMSPFEINVNGYGFFEPNVIYLNVISSKPLLNLHLKILKELKENYNINKSEFEGKNKQFHTTLAYRDLTSKNFFKAKEELETSVQPKFSFKFNSIGLFRYIGKEWVVHKKFKIKI